MLLPENFLGIPARVRRQFFHRSVFWGMHVLALGVFFFTPSVTDISLFLVWMFLNGVGLTVGYHRLLSHNSFECPLWTKRLLAFLGAQSLMGRPQVWVAVHRRHHQVVDEQGVDPHTPLDGFYYAHQGWIVAGVEAVAEEHRKLAADLDDDWFFRALDRETTESFPWLISAIICYMLGGWTGVMWGAVFKTVYVWQTTWCINSVCHVFGSQPYEIPEHAGNVWWLGILAFGEGWHNNHHAFPDAAYVGHHWWQMDPAGYVIWAMERVGLAWNVKRPRSPVYAFL